MGDVKVDFPQFGSQSCPPDGPDLMAIKELASAVTEQELSVSDCADLMSDAGSPSAFETTASAILGDWYDDLEDDDPGKTPAQNQQAAKDRFRATVKKLADAASEAFG